MSGISWRDHKTNVNKHGWPTSKTNRGSEKKKARMVDLIIPYKSLAAMVLQGALDGGRKWLYRHDFCTFIPIWEFEKKLSVSLQNVCPPEAIKVSKILISIKKKCL